MTGGSPFGFGFGLAPMPMPGPVDADPGQMQLDDEQRRAIVSRLLGSQMFHPGNGPAVMAALDDQGQDQGPGQGGGQAPTPAPAQDSSGPGLNSPLASVLGGALPSMLGGQMPAPQMPAPPQQQDGPAAAPASIPSMIGSAFPQMSVLGGGSQAAGAIPQRPVQAPAQAPTGDDEEGGAAPAATPPASGASTVPLPPTRPSDLSSLGAAGMPPSGQFDPLTGQPVSGSPRPIQGDFDPLTGQPVWGSPRPLAMGAPGGGAPGGAVPARQGPEPEPGSPAWAKEHPVLDAWRRFGESGAGDQLLAFGAGMLQGHGFADGAGKGFQNMLAVSQSRSAGDMQRLEYALKLQKAQQEQSNLTGNANFVKSIFAKNGQDISDSQALTLGSNPTFMNEILKGIMPSTEQYTQFNDAEGNRWSRNQRTGQETIALKKEEDKTQTPLLSQEDRAAAGIKPDDTRTAWIDANKKVTFNDGPAETAAIKEYQRAVREDGYKGTLLQWKQDTARAGANQTTINMPPGEQARDKKIGDAVGTDIADYISAARPAREKMAALNILEDAWKTGGDKITTGPMAERVLGLKQFARGTLGMNIGDDISPSELISKIGTQLATADAKSLTARPTQFDFATYLKNNPGLTLTPEGNAALINIKKQQAQHEMDLAALARKKENWDNWDDVVADYDRKHPIISPLTGRALGAANVDFPGASGGGQGGNQQPPPAAASRAALEAEARRRGLIR